VVIGNGDILKADPWWKNLLTFAMRNNAYQGPPIPSIDVSSAESFSRLEEEWTSRNGINGSVPLDTSTVGARTSGDERDIGFIVAGSVVRETLREDP